MKCRKNVKEEGILEHWRTMKELWEREGERENVEGEEEEK